jgi:hypothetical protein
MSESDGSGSTTRVLIFGLVIAAIAWSSILCFDAHKHKITVEQFNSYLSSIGQYLTVTATPLYAVNKTADVFNNKNKQSGQNGN